MASIKNPDSKEILVRDTLSGDIFVLQPGNNEFSEELCAPGRLVKHEPDYKTYPELKSKHWGSPAVPVDAEPVVQSESAPEAPKDELSDVI
jgi:hypothetical protein